MNPYYSDSLVTIYHGDCREVLPFVTADLLLTDPPYGIRADKRQHDGAKRGGMSGRGCAAKRDYGASDWDTEPPDASTLALILSKAPLSIIWGGNYMALPPARCWLVWDKDNGTTKFADAELAWTNINQPVRLISHRWNGMLRAKSDDGDYRVHPTQKPVPVMRWCLGFAPEARTVIDPYMGSGTTLIAARDLGKRAVGVEREERYCEIAAERCRQEVLDFGGVA